MASSPLPDERPPPQNFRRSFTLPARQLSVHEKASLDKADASAEILYSHPHARIISFSPPKESIVSTTTAAIPPDTDYPVDTVETLPWRSRTETSAASGRMLIEKVRGSTNFLKCQDVMHAILRNSQCWCVDGESKFVLRVRKLQYYRIELPSTTEQDKQKVEELKSVLPTVLRYERTPCPFIRAFQVDLPDDAITPRRKGAWKRRDSSQPGTPETETPPVRLSKSTRSYSLRSPPSAYPTNGPGYVSQSPDHRPGSSAGLYRRTSNFERKIESDSPANMITRGRRSEQDDVNSDHDSEPASDSEGTAESPNEEDVRGRQVTSTSREARSVSVSARVAAFETVRAESISRSIKRPEPPTRGSMDGKKSHEIQHEPELQVDMNNTNDLDSLQSPLQALSDNPSEIDLDVLPETEKEPEHPNDVVQTRVGMVIDSQDEADSHIGAETISIEEQDLPGQVEQEIADAEQVYQEKPPSEDQNDLPVYQSLTPVTIATVDTESTETDQNFQQTHETDVTLENENSKILSIDGAADSNEGDTLTQAAETLSQTIPISKSHPDPNLKIDLDPTTDKHMDVEAVQPQNTATHIQSDPEEPDQSEQASEDLPKEPSSDRKLPPTETAVVEDYGIDDDNMSTVSSVDSFHTMSPTGSINTDFLQTPIARQLDPFLSPTQGHKRGTSEATIMTSTASDGGFDIETPLARSGYQWDEGVDGYALHGALSNATIAAVTANDPESTIRHRLRAHRSFSPPPPASTIFTGTHPRHDTSHHMTKAILQKAIVKPVEVLVLVIHILSRIASGATVSDLLSGELFRRPEHRRRVSGFADQLSGDNEDADFEDDYGIPIRARSNKTNQRSTTGDTLGPTSYGNEDDAESFISVD